MGVTVRSDPGWMRDFRKRYAAWWPAARPLIEQHEYGAAFKSYPWPTFAECPWTPVTKPLATSRVAVVTTGGLYLRDVDPPFRASAPDGDPGFRRLPRAAWGSAIGLAHEHYPREVAKADLNTIYPLERLGELRTEGIIGDVAPTHYSIMGYQTDAAALAEHTAPVIAAGMLEEGVDAALLVPV